MRVTFSRRATSTVTVAVMPGFSLSSGLGASMTVAYVTTFCVTIGSSRICETEPSNSSAGNASTVNVTRWLGRIRPTSDSSMFAMTRILVRSAAMTNSSGA